MRKETALYIKADPFTFNEMDLITKAIDSFEFVHILLDRMNRDSDYGDYQLSFNERAELVNFELKKSKISSYDIIPVDISIQNTLTTNNIGNLILNYDQQNETGFKMLNLYKEMFQNTNVMLMNGERFCCEDIVRKLITSDETMQKYKNYCSERSFGKFKLKSVYKIAISGDSDEDLDVVQKVFEDRGIQTIDLDAYMNKLPKSKMKSNETISQELVKHIANTILGSFNQKIVVRSKKIYEYGIDKLLNSNIYLSDCVIPDNKEGISEYVKKNMAEHVIEFRQGEESARNQMIKLFNKRYQKI